MQTRRCLFDDREAHALVPLCCTVDVLACLAGGAKTASDTIDRQQQVRFIGLYCRFGIAGPETAQEFDLVAINLVDRR